MKHQIFIKENNQNNYMLVTDEDFQPMLFSSTLNALDFAHNHLEHLEWKIKAI